MRMIASRRRRCARQLELEQPNLAEAGALAVTEHQMVDDCAIERFCGAGQAAGRAAVAVAPLPSRGALQTPIIEAMASAVPVVTTSHAADGIAATHGRHLYLEDSTPSFAQRVIQLLEEPALRHQIGSQGRSLVCAHYTCDAAAARLAETAAAIVPAPFPAPRRPRRSLSPVQGA